jgi:peptidoglycan hydrolase CwlO-like protein
MNNLKNTYKSIFSAFLAFVLSVLPLQSLAQSAISCSDITDISQKSEDQLRQYLNECEKEIADQQVQLDGQEQQSKSIKGDISILTTKISQSKLDIKAKNALIEQLSRQISSKNATIGQLSSKLQDKKDSLAQLIRKTMELDQTSFAYMVLSGRSLSDFYSDLDSFSYINKAVKESVDEIKGIKTDTENQKSLLEKDQNSEVDAKVALETSKKKIEQSESEKQTLLKLSKQKEDQYKKYISDQSKKAAQIRTALFALRDAASIPFDQALKYAQQAQSKTGVRPAFLLAILTQESNLGKNVGSCYLTDQSTGAGIGAKSGAVIAKVMNPSRDIPPFVDILNSLGRQIYKTLVSCPQSVGWGGAMGPAQFIPSTWNLFSDRIAAAAGKAYPDPWDPGDAFIASSLYLGDLGASSGGYSAERNSACKYYSGKSCGYSSVSASYGDQVMAKAAAIQDNIDFLQGA